ncbi:M20 family peptidase [Haloarcula sp. CBA1130]|uniref:M20 family metallopeptidase n=1 Tax=unclassified Haloarcula TaxID=2624677 RepID=UPI001248D97A|nr:MULTISPECIES: M20/M25/M40 family metallo-hydrolase [unclassified Haloarcula]KAA9396695.1 M20 family peptidase [Haloarcula sp. CBA1130]KAA9397616.1 M20 family peptidase [Haloarcula sp. CBA1129]
MSDVTPSEYVRAHREELVTLALNLLAIDTSNPPGETCEIVAEIEQFLGPLPVEVERFAADPAKPNLLVRVPSGSDHTLLYSGHLDTVPFDAEAWSYAPLGERVDERVYGRGATDMKGAVASMLFAIRAVTATDTEPPVDLQFAFVSDEEVGGDAGLPALLDTGRLDADACVIGEPTCEEGRHSVTVADRGSIWLTLEASGEGAHGSRPVLGVNAIDRLYDAIETMRERFGTQRLEIDDDVAPIVEESVEYYASSMGEATVRDLFWYPSINLGVLEGGDAINTVPQSAYAEVDVRLTAGVHTPDVLAEIRECVADCKGITIADVSWSVGTAEDPASPLVEAVASTAEEITGNHVFRRSATGGGDAKKLRNAGISTVEFALGTDTVHAHDEYVPVDVLVDNAVVYAQLPARWQSQIDR